MRKQGAFIASPIVAHKPVLFHPRRPTDSSTFPPRNWISFFFMLTELFIIGLRAGCHNRTHPRNLSFPIRFSTVTRALLEIIKQFWIFPPTLWWIIELLVCVRRSCTNKWRHRYIWLMIDQTNMSNFVITSCWPQTFKHEWNEPLLCKQTKNYKSRCTRMDFIVSKQWVPCWNLTCYHPE